ncbi:hypothetical protein ACFQYP_44260 [Nonomuraea antimicrobica]
MEALLASDPSVVVIGRVFDVLAWQRTDLLDAALGRRAPVGRFAKKGCGGCRMPAVRPYDGGRRRSARRTWG